MISQKEFNQNLKRISRTALAVMIPLVGMKSKQEEILWLYYIKEKSLYDISLIMGVTYETAANDLSAARKSMANIIKEQAAFLSPEIKGQIHFLLKQNNY